MNIRKSLLILFMVTVIILSINPLSAIGQWYSPSYTINIYMSPYSQTTSNSLNPFSWDKGAPFFDPWMASFPFGFSSGFGAWTDWNNFDNDTSNDSTDDPELYPIKHLGHAEAITDDYLVICSGQSFGKLNENAPISIYDLQIIDLTDSAEYKKIGELRFESESGFFGSGEVKKLLVEQNFAYILINDPAGFYIINLENFETPQLIDYQDLNFVSAQDMEINNGWAFIAFNDYNSIIASWNISNPQDISFQDNIVLNGWIKDIFIDQEILLAIGDYNSGLNIIDISDPMAMELLNNLDLCGEAVWMTGGGILTAGGDYDWISRIRVLDYRDFLDPIQIASLNLVGKEQDVCAEGNNIYVLSTSIYTNQSQIFTFLMDEETLKLEPLKIINIDGICHNLKIFQGFLMAAQENQILFWDITNPTEPSILESFKIDFSVFIDYYSDYTEEEKKDKELSDYKDSGWPFNPFFFFTNNPFSYSNSWSTPFTNFFPPGLNWNQDTLQGRNNGNGPNRYSFTYNNWQSNTYASPFQGSYTNFPENMPWEGSFLFDFITGIVQTSLSNLEFLFLEEDQ